MRISHFRSLRLGFLTCALLALLATASQAQTSLRWKFQKGEKLNYTMNQRVAKTISDGSRKFEQTESQIIDTSWVVNNVTSGMADLTLSIDRFRYSMEGEGQKVAYDSRDGKLPEGPYGQAYGPIFAAMAGPQLNFKMSPQGEITEVKLAEKLLERLRNMPGGPAGGQFQEETIKQMFTHSTLLLPAMPVARGATWKKESDLESPNFKSKLNNIYTYQGPAPEAAGKLEQIDVTIQTKIEAPPSGPKTTLKSDDSKGKFLFDNQKGNLSECTLSQKQELEVSAMNTNIVITTDTTATMKLSSAS